MTERDAIHTRLDYMEEKLDNNFRQMSDNISQMAIAIKELSERYADVSLLTDRSNQHSKQIDNLDTRLDEIEKQMPLIQRFISRADKISLALTISIMLGIFYAIYKV